MSGVRHNSNDHQFEIPTPHGLAFVTYDRDEGDLTLIHTEVPPEAEGQGLAAKVVTAALAWARDNDLRVIPQCAYVAGYVRRHPEFEDVVHPEHRPE
jgi:predicted GNAT family acetyltransferase